MNIVSFIGYLNKRNGWNLSSSYYAFVEEWKQWWQGHYDPFHSIQYQDATGETKKRRMYSMRMPKKICEDWASLLLNERTGITVGDDNTQKWLTGDNQTGGVLWDLDFWPNANALVELAFRSGTGAFVMTLDGIKTTGSGRALQSPEAQISMDYLPAECIIPITVKRKRIVDVAFLSEVLLGGEACLFLQTHRMTDSGYEITNEYFRAKADDKDKSTEYEEMPLPDGMTAKVKTGSKIPWFSILSPNTVKHLPGGTGMGVAIFADALDQVRAVDRAFNNLVKDIELGGKKVFYNSSLVRTVVDEKGNTVQIVPDDVMQQLFMQMGDGDGLGDEKPVQEYNPSLRVNENVDAVQNALNYLSFKCGLGTHHYQFDGASITTATQYSGDRQDMRQNVVKHQIFVESALIGIVRTMLWAGKNILGAQVDDSTEITISFDDGYFTDTESQRALMAQDVRDKVIPGYLYVMQWYDKTEEEAKELVKEAGGGDSNGGLFDL